MATPRPRRAGDKTQTDADRRAAGRVSVKVWLEADEAAALEQLAAETSRRDAIGAALLAAARKKK